MAADAIPPLSFESQHHEEYIDYSEDDVAGPPVTANGSNQNSFSANAQFIADVTGNAEKSTEMMDAQDMVEPVVVSSDAQLGNDQESIDTNNTESAISIDEVPQEHKSATYNENEISWEDNTIDGPVENSGASQPDSEKNNWQLVDEEVNPAEDPEFPDSLLDDEQQTYSEGEEASIAPVGGNVDAVDTNTQEPVVADVDSSFEEQTNSAQDLGVDGDLHEIDYFEDGNTAANASAEDTEAQPESYDLGQENASQTHTDDGVEDRNTGEGPDTTSQNEIENAIAADDEEDVDAQNVEGLADDGQDYTATGDDASVHEHMDYEDEVLADVQSPESVDTPSNEDMEIPVITVSYKGVEYPFFYNSPDSEGKECFFDDLSLLHCKMEGVLAGFRRELANELGPFDELVFQIDELGLEFAESTQPDEISDITLGQVVSVFDSLVKNQNPDASKPLYALLVTRPNCKKRWLSLVDDAYNGKGLDEVSYYFASQAHSEADEPEIMDDITGMIGEEDNVDATAWPNSPGESDHDDQEAAQDQVEVDDQVGEDDQVEEDIQAEEDEVTEDADVSASIVEEDDVTQVHDPVDEDTLGQELLAAGDLDAETTMVDTDFPLMDESTAVVDIDPVENSMMDLMEDQEPQTSGKNGPETEASNPFTNVGTEEADLHNAVGDDQHWPDGEDITAVVGQITEGTNESSANKVTPNTSATSTLNGDDVAYGHNELDLSVDVPENEDQAANAGGEDDELAEIDWREFPGQGDNEVSESPSVAGKRPRSDADDLLEEEAEKDVKRRRP